MQVPELVHRQRLEGSVEERHCVQPPEGDRHALPVDKEAREHETAKRRTSGNDPQRTTRNSLEQHNQCPGESSNACARDRYRQEQDNDRSREIE